MALVGLGGYVPFGPAVQKEKDGGRSTTSFHPMLTLNTNYPMFFDHFFTPQIGLVLHGDKYDETKKKTVFILWDVAYSFNSSLLLRYGFGSFLTKVGGDGGTISMPNGNSTTTFAKPDKTVTSYNTTLNLGVEYGLNRHYSAQFETYVFNTLDKQSREVSYSLSVNYYSF